MLARLHAYVSHSWNPTVEPTVQHSRQSSMDSVDTNPQSFLGPCEAASKLPTELHDHIIDSVSRWDIHTLGNCALVSSEWLSRSRQLVFRDVSIHPRKAQAFLRLIAIPWSTIPPYVRSLSLTEGSGMPGQREGAWLNEALTLLMKLQGIDTLRIANANFYGTDLDIIVKFFSNFRKLKELQLLLCDIEHPTNSILGIVITSCRRLESILLDTVMLGPRGAFNPDDQFKIPASLRSVEIRSCNQAVFLDCLVSTNSIPKVNTLYLGPPIFLGQTSRIAHFVNTIGPTLRLLELQCGSGMTFSGDTLFSHLRQYADGSAAMQLREEYLNPFPLTDQLAQSTFGVSPFAMQTPSATKSAGSWLSCPKSLLLEWKKSCSRLALANLKTSKYLTGTP